MSTTTKKQHDFQMDFLTCSAQSDVIASHQSSSPVLWRNKHFESKVTIKELARAWCDSCEAWDNHMTDKWQVYFVYKKSQKGVANSTISHIHRTTAEAEGGGGDLSTLRWHCTAVYRRWTSYVAAGSDFSRVSLEQKQSLSLQTVGAYCTRAFTSLLFLSNVFFQPSVIAPV